MHNLADLETDLEQHAVGLDPATIAAALAALVGLVAQCRNKTPAAAAITGNPGLAETALLRGAILRELRERGERPTPHRVEAALTALLEAQRRAAPQDRAQIADELTKWDLA